MKVISGYRQKFVCFDCFRCIKSRQVSTIRDNVGGYMTTVHLPLHRDIRCCSCNKDMEMIGPKFRPPKQSDKASWLRSKQMYKTNAKCFHYIQAEIEEGHGT